MGSLMQAKGGLRWFEIVYGCLMLCFPSTAPFLFLRSAIP